MRALWKKKTQGEPQKVLSKKKSYSYKKEMTVSTFGVDIELFILVLAKSKAIWL